MSSRANIYIDQGADFRVSLELFDADNDELDVDNYNIFATMRKLYSTTKITDFDVEKGPDGNDVTLVLPDEITVNLKPGKYQYDVLMEKPTGEISKIAEGLAIVVGTITDTTTYTPSSVNQLPSDGVGDGGTF
jgi:hypothetical protein